MRTGWLRPALPSGAQLKAVFVCASKMDQNTLRSLISYDPDTGVFIKLKNRKPVGLTGPRGYRQITFGKKKYYAHRLAWIYCHGDIPEGLVIDHIDRDKSNNRISNLRVCTTAQNQQNQKSAKSNNNSGFLGVRFDSRLKKYTAKITTNGRTVHLGAFPTGEAANEAYLDAKRRIHDLCPV